MTAKNIVNLSENKISNLTFNFNENTIQERNIEHVSFQLNEPVSSFTGRKIEIRKLHRILIDEEQDKLVICGMGGIGKSELIRAYCDAYKAEYQNNVIWINAETQNDIKKSFYELAAELNVPTTNSFNMERNLKEIVKEEYSYFKGRKCLVIFDNAMCLKVVQTYLPTSNNSITVLLSSQNKEWGNITKLELGVLLEEESIALLNSICPQENQEDVKCLVNMLQFLPLALQQAAAYIVDKKIIANNRYKVRDYIEVFDKEEAILTVTYDDCSPFPDYSEQIYDKTIYKTLQITLANIKKELALEILYICAYLAPDNIDKSLFRALINIDGEAKIDEAFRVLEKYFLITVNRNHKYMFMPFFSSASFCTSSSNVIQELQQTKRGDIIFIHRVIQKILRYILKYQQDTDHYLEEGLLLTTADYETHGIHVSSILKYATDVTCLHFYKNICQNKEAFLCVVGREQFFDILKILLGATEDNDFDIRNSVLPIHVALGGHLDMMKYIIQKGANVSIQNINGITATHAASQNNRLDLLSYLIKIGTSINGGNNKGYTPLHVAVLNNHLDIVKYLINNGASTTAAAHDGCTMLIIAAQYGHLELTKYLLGIGSRIDIPDNDGFVSVHFAAQDNRLDVLECLVKEYGAPMDLPAFNGFTPLHFGAQNGHLAVVQCLVDNGRVAIDSIEINGYTALLLATQNNHQHIVQYLIDKCANVNVASTSGLTSLHIASGNENMAILMLLINQGASVNATNHEQTTPLHVAAENGYSNVAKLLIDHGANINATTIDGLTPLHMAVKMGFLETVKYLTCKGAIVDSPASSNGFTGLHFACLYGHLEIVQLLNEIGACVNAISKNGGYSPLHISSFNGYIEIVQYMMNHGASINAITDDGATALHLAAENGHLDVVQYLNSQGMSVKTVAKNGCIPLHFASKKGHLNVIQYMVHCGCSINVQCNNGSTPLHFASLGNHLNVVQYLVNEGADINRVCSTGQTATDLAILNSHVEVAQYLLDNGGVITFLEYQDEN